MLNNNEGQLFFPEEEWRLEIKRRAHALNQKYNALTEYQTEERRAVLKELLGELNDGVSFNGPIRFHYGVHTKIGENTFFNFNFTCQDDTEVTIGKNCDFGPNVTIVTPLHPMLQSERKQLMCPDGVGRRLCWAKPVTIGDGCWICANVTILPGVTIGDNCVIGAGSVVTHSIPGGSFAAGNPCRVIRKLGEEDSLKNRPELLGDCSVIENPVCEKPEEGRRIYKYEDLEHKASSFESSMGNKFGYITLKTPSEPGKKLPLLIYLAGGDGRGDDLAKLTDKVQSVPYYIKKGTLDLKRECIIAAPQIGAGENWNRYAADVVELIKHIAEEENADMQAISLTGCSYGGMGTFAVAIEAPDMFSCIVPVCAEVDPQQCRCLTRMPVRIFHGEKDTGMGFSVYEALRVINTSGGDARITILSGEGHEIRHIYYDDEYDTVDWMLRQRKK